MKPPYFDLVIAETLEEVTDCLKQHGADAKIIAGGQSLMAMLNMRLVKPKLLIDISRISELDYARRDKGFVEIGAAVTQAKLEAWDDLDSALPLLARAIPHIGHLQTRNRGTVCGSICHSDPSSELPLSLATLRGEVVLSGARGRRVLEAHEFQTGMLSTACGPEEFVSAVRFPVAKPGQGFSFHEVARRHGDFAVVALAAVAEGKDVRLGIGGVSDKPEVLELKNAQQADLEGKLNAFAWSLGASDDIHASARYRRELVRRLGLKTVKEACDAAS
ncbi:FAD binding domain-containing protein [Leisingera daeponensis]|uniref:FAD binding domain-containing protein n=1 Tax=Leisingera daeponensis TaxID=405746 RepID=UPI001C9381EC|nr:FAD binding domain-containing protein [Leisingera daeponensis]MBY6058775.1 FAD binding domain-containing protein [Leisingera daeponensis]